MPRYLIEATYTLEGVRGIVSAGGTTRRDAAAATCESVGGKLVSLDFALGERDIFLICELPDNEAAVAVSLAVNASGRTKARTIPLISPEEVDAAAQRSVPYRAPGQ
ncbi:MAG TPA: GYD domain-containing protein [Solirubrobacteraceae bacterium]|jgi:uncharacterized protein with GYD domain